MKYREAIVKSMKMLSDKGYKFVGQSVCWPGNSMFGTLEDADVPYSQRKEFPVMEDSQLGWCTGQAMYGNKIVCLFPRIDFMMRCMDQLVNHLDKWKDMSHGEWNPKVIIRTAVGTTEPLHPGVQHMQDHTEGLREILQNIKALNPKTPKQVMMAYDFALRYDYSTIIVEYNELY